MLDVCRSSSEMLSRETRGKSPLGIEKYSALNPYILKPKYVTARYFVPPYRKTLCARSFQIGQYFRLEFCIGEREKLIVPAVF